MIASEVEPTFPVVEIFGPTIQGEGYLAGKPTHFVRLGLCDFKCKWCDSAHAVLPELVRLAPRMTERQVLEEVLLLPIGPRWVTISGGNPAIHDIGNLVAGLHKEGYFVAVETQGSRWKNWLGEVDMLTISPKPPSSGMTNLGFPGFIELARASRATRSCIKVVVFDEKDYDFAKDVHRTHPSFPFYLSVGTLMGGLDGTYAGGKVDTTESILERYKWLAERVARDKAFRDTSVFPQLHALIWGHGRGH